MAQSSLYNSGVGSEVDVTDDAGRKLGIVENIVQTLDANIQNQVDASAATIPVTDDGAFDVGKVSDLTLEDAAGTGTFGNIHRRGDALQASIEADQVGLLAAADQPFDVSGATVTVTDDGALAISSLPEPVDVSGATVSVQESTALDVSAAEVDVDIATQTLARIVGELELEDAGATGSYGNIHRRGDALQISIESDQAGLLTSTDQPFDVSGATVTVADDGTFTVSSGPLDGALSSQATDSLLVDSNAALDVSASTVPVSAGPAGGLDVSGATVSVQESTALDVSGATVNVQEATPLDASAATVTTTDDGTFDVRNAGIAATEDRVTATATNASVSPGQNGGPVTIVAETTGAAVLTVEVSNDGFTTTTSYSVDIADSNGVKEEVHGYSDVRAQVDANLTALHVSVKGL